MARTGGLRRRALHIALGVLAVLVAVVAGSVWYSLIFPRQPFEGPLPALTAEEADLAGRLRTHVTAVASKPHNLAHPAELEASAQYIEGVLKGLGYTPVPLEYEVDGKRARNIEVVIEPTGNAADGETLVVGAHYDSAGLAPGANDNGTGVAATLELARLLRDFKPDKNRVRLLFWVNEEAPYGLTPEMGSLQHAKLLKANGEKLIGAISLETLGYFSDEPGSQRFPFPIGLFYGDRGNFVTFVGLLRSRAFVRRALGSFRAETAFPSIGGVVASFIKGVDWSDHWSYDQMGYPAVMITDTALFRNPQYHLETDLPDTVNYESLARITKGIERMVRDLAQ